MDINDFGKGYTLAGIAVLAWLVTSCSSDASTESDAAPPEHPTASSTPLEPEPHQLSFLPLPGGEAPDALVDIPVGFEDGAVRGDVAPNGRGWYVVSASGQEFLGLSVVTWVQRDACSHLEDTVTPGPSVGELVEAIAAQESTDTSEPEPVTLSGFDGMYLELAGPDHLSSCGDHPWLWETRGIYGDGQVDRLWILDVEGQRVVVDASYTQDSVQDDIEKLVAIVDSLEIVTAAR